MTDNAELFSNYVLNSSLTLKNRIVMAPMTRAKATEELVPTKTMADYYARRADAGLIITEGTVISMNASGYSNVPGIFEKPQMAAWRGVTDAVHKNNGLIFLQIWHVGRVSHPNFLNGVLPISPSETEMSGPIPRTKGLNYGKSRAATLSEINEIILSYKNAAKNAIDAGFDGIEIHGANGYLIDQFLHVDTNKRTDRYGGNVENMARFALDIVHACGQAIGYERVGLRLTPGTYLNQIKGEEKDQNVFKFLLEELNQLNIAYVHTGNFDDRKTFPELNNKSMTEFMRTHYHGTLIACGSYSPESAAEGISNKNFDLIAFGRPFIAHPDLIHRLQTQQTLNSYDVSMLETLY